VWATDLWFDATENLQRIRDAGVEDGVFPLHADARSLPYAAEFFDAALSIDSYFYFGTDDLYLNTLARLVRPGGQLGIAGAAIMQELDGSIPDHLRDWWTPDVWCLHSADWWRRHWQKSGVVDISHADTMTDGWQFWRDWVQVVAPENLTEIQALETDAGRTLGYFRVVARRRTGVQLEEPVVTVPAHYVKKPLLGA
jgi:cyclopropane fatty-acyl-phospholipid synthase-like methyltransferase